MIQLEDLLIKIWIEEIPPRFEKGLLTYERQLQAEFYHRLKLCLPDGYEVWIEPVIYLADYNLNKVKPDIFITKDDKIEAIIELKFKPWEYPEFHFDINKLLTFDNISNENLQIAFGYIPRSHIWNVQKGKQNVQYKLTQEHLNVYVVFGKPDSGAFNTNNYQKPKNFLLLYGYIKENHASVFSVSK